MIDLDIAHHEVDDENTEKKMRVNAAPPTESGVTGLANYYLPSQRM